MFSNAVYHLDIMIDLKCVYQLAITIALNSCLLLSYHQCYQLLSISWQSRLLSTATMITVKCCLSVGNHECSQLLSTSRFPGLLLNPVHQLVVRLVSTCLLLWLSRLLSTAVYQLPLVLLKSDGNWYRK